MLKELLSSCKSQCVAAKLGDKCSTTGMTNIQKQKKRQLIPGISGSSPNEDLTRQAREDAYNFVNNSATISSDHCLTACSTHFPATDGLVSATNPVKRMLPQPLYFTGKETAMYKS